METPNPSSPPLRDRQNPQYRSLTNFHQSQTPSNPEKRLATTYTDSVLWGQSSSTWLHSSPLHSFPKAMRFQEKAASIRIDNITLPSTLGKKATSLGYSQKQFIPESQLNNAKNIPASNFYHLSDFLELDERALRGKSFGISYQHYQRVYTPEMKHYPHPMFFKSNPGPGSYNVVGEPGKNKLKYSLYGKGKTFVQMQKNEYPAANYYTPKRVLTEASRFRNPSFGFGNKLDLSKAANNNPGPGSYRLPSVFDKCKRKKKESETPRIHSKGLEISENGVNNPLPGKYATEPN